MKHVIVVVYDRAVGAYAKPFCVPSVGAGIRMFQDEVNRPAQDNPLYVHPEDFELFELGTFDDGGAEFNLLDNPKQIAYAKSLKT